MSAHTFVLVADRRKPLGQTRSGERRRTRAETFSKPQQADEVAAKLANASITAAALGLGIYVETYM